MQNLHFVTETGKARPHGTIRNLIRSHARRGRIKQLKVVAPDLVLNEEEENNIRDIRDQDTKSRSPWMSKSYKQKIQNAQVDRGPGNNAFDTFSILPVGEQGHALALINHCA
jgi:hypothetical protein